MARPVDGIGQAEAALILACHRWTVGPYVKAGRLRSAGRNVRRGLSRADVEALACQIYPWRDHLDDLAPYWVTAERATRILGVNHARLNQLAVRGFVPFEMHVDAVPVVSPGAARGRRQRPERACQRGNRDHAERAWGPPFWR
jgi:hypothetical protein